jgi:hypothetical protein
VSSGGGSIQRRAAFPEPRPPSWKNCLEDARRETHPHPLLARVHAAETALYSRWQELQADRTDLDERSEMRKASDELLGIKVHKLGWPALHG